MRLLHGADFHIGLANFGRTVDEFGASFDKFVDVAIREKVDLAVVAGDTFHNRRPGPKELQIVAAATRRLVSARVPVVFATGNHDGMATIADPDTQTLGWLDAMRLDGVYVSIQPALWELDECFVAALPYAHKRAISNPTLSLQERTEESSRVLAESITKLHDTASHLPKFRSVNGPDRPIIFVGHLTTEHASLGAEAAMHMGWDTTVDPAVFDEYDYAALGHIHVGQQVSDKAWYAGSPDVHAFNEKAEDKRFLLVEVERGKLPQVEVIPTEPRPLVTRIVTQMHDGRWENHAPFPEGAIVQIEFRPLVQMDAKVVREVVDHAKKRGAAFVRTVITEPEIERRRVASSAAEAPVTEQVDAWLETQEASPRKTKERARDIAQRALAP